MCVCFFSNLHTPQYTSPRHPVVACALSAYDVETSPLNECLLLSKGQGYGGLDCVLETLEACTQEVSGDGPFYDRSISCFRNAGGIYGGLDCVFETLEACTREVSGDYLTLEG